MTSHGGLRPPSLLPLLPLLLISLLLGPAGTPTAATATTASERRHRHQHQHGLPGLPGLPHGSASAVEALYDLRGLRAAPAGTPPTQAAAAATSSPGRRCVCPAPQREAYCRPRLIPFAQRCAGDQICRGVRMVCETAYREVVRPRLACCPSIPSPGPSPGPSARSGPPSPPAGQHDCQQPLCRPACENGGTCERTDSCACPPGYAGHRCQADLDECDESAPRRCDHVCVNTVGSFRCDCRPGFALQPDGRTCQPLGKPAGIAPDPTDGDFEFLAKKLAKLEKILLVRQRHELEEEAEDREDELPRGLEAAAVAAQAVAKLSARLDSLQTEVHQLRLAEHHRCTRVQERLTRLEESCSRIAVMEHKIHQFTSGCRNRNLNQVWP